MAGQIGNDVLTRRERRFMWHQRAAAVFDSLAGQTYYAAQVDHFLLAAGGDIRALAVHSGTVRSCVALVSGLLGPTTGSASDTFGRRPMLILWNASWLLRPLALMASGTLRGRLITEVCVAVLGSGGGSARQAAFADMFGNRPELSAALQAKVAMWGQVTNLVSASVGRFIALRWGLRSTFVASAAFASISMAIVVTNPETLDPTERRPLPSIWQGLRRANPLSNIWLLFSHGHKLQRLSLATLFFSLAGGCNASQDSYRLGALQWSPLDIATYLQFTPPLHGILQGHAIARE
jgi:MFS family permease